MKKGILILTSSVLTLSCQENKIEKIDLSGNGSFKPIPKTEASGRSGRNELSDVVRLPGSMEENGKGDDITFDTQWTGGINDPEWFTDPNYAPYVNAGNIRFPFWLQPEKKYTGAAWYRKKVSIPEEWKEKTVLLTLERPHWESMVWVNGEQIGMQNSLATPHVFDISSYLKAGENVVIVRIDNRIKDIDVGINSHSITDHTQSNWNGIVGEISLRATRKDLI